METFAGQKREEKERRERRTFKRDGLREDHTGILSGIFLSFLLTVLRSRNINYIKIKKE